jgi:hypothetical protein
MQAILLVGERVWEHLRSLEMAEKQLSRRFSWQRGHLACSQLVVAKLP